MHKSVETPVPSHASRLQLSPRAVLALKCLAVLLVAGALVHLGRRTATSITVGRMAAAIRTSDDPSAARLVDELAAFGPPAYPHLLRCASSQRSAVALAARAQVESLLDAWQREVHLAPATFSLDTTALPLAQAVIEPLEQMTDSGRRWARKVLLALLDLAESQDVQQRIELIKVCDRGLSSLPADTSPPTFDPDDSYRLTLAPPPALPQPQFAAEPHTVGALPGIAARSAPAPESHAPESHAPESHLPERVATNPLRTTQPPTSDWTPAAPAARPDPLPISAATAARVPAQPASTKRTSDIDSDETRNAGESNNLPELFALLASGDPAQQTAAARALELRGFGVVSPREARMATSASAADRLALVNLSLTSPRLETGEWLWHLAHDAAGEVRAAAVASILTSGNQPLVDAALKLALEDTDPRVARQAESLRQLNR